MTLWRSSVPSVYSINYKRKQTKNGSTRTSLLLHLSPAALAAALAAALPPRLIEYLQRKWTLTHLAKSTALDGVSRERLLNPYDGRTAGFAALKWGGITRAYVFFCQHKSEPNRQARQPTAHLPGLAALEPLARDDRHSGGDAGCRRESWRRRKIREERWW